jgi:hypothetical protein
MSKGPAQGAGPTIEMEASPPLMVPRLYMSAIRFVLPYPLVGTAAVLGTEGLDATKLSDEQSILF